MTTSKRLFSLWTVIAALAWMAPATASDDPPAGPQKPVVIVLARHAEPHYPPHQDHPPNPELNAAGRERAEALAHSLASAGITDIHSTDLHRTLQTAAPLAETTGLEIQIYDPRALEELAARLRSTPGRHFVSGHSNTTPELVALLGGEPGEPIVVDSEFDRMYVLTFAPEGGVTTLLLRYGAPPAALGEEDGRK